MRFALLLLAALAVPAAAGEVVEHPHLVLSDGLGNVVPPPEGPFTNEGVFPATGGFPFDATVSYEAAGGDNQLAWALLLSGFPTPFPRDVLPPPLLVLPPFVFLAPPDPLLDPSGNGTITMSVPTGVYFAEAYLQAIVLDPDAAPQLQLGNGVEIEVSPPGFTVGVAYMKNLTGVDPIAEVGDIDLDSGSLNQLKPFGPQPPPTAQPDDLGQDPLGTDPGIFRFDPIVPNENRAGPTNPMDRPRTALAAPLFPDQPTMQVTHARGFPPRGLLLVSDGITLSSGAGGNPFGGKGGQNLPPRVEVVWYDDIDLDSQPPRFVGLKRNLPGTTQGGTTQDATVHTTNGAVVIAPFLFASTTEARVRSRVGVEAQNRDAPRLVIPPFEVPGGGADGETVTMDLDLILYSSTTSLSAQNVVYKRRGFMVLDRTTNEYRLIPGTSRSIAEGDWDPMVHVSPDGRFVIAGFRVADATQPPAWDFLPDQLWAIRLDGLAWPASGAETWRITWPVGADPDPNAEDPPTQIAARRIHMPAVRVLGTDPEDFVLYAGIGHKFRRTGEGNNVQVNVGTEAAYVREDTIVNEIVEMPLVPPGSTKALPPLQAPLIRGQFGDTGFGEEVARFDPIFEVNEANTMMLVAGGPTIGQEDAYVVRNVSVNANATVTKLIANVTGHRDAATSAGQFGGQNVRNFHAPGYFGHGKKAAFSPSSTRVAFVVQDPSPPSSSSSDRMDYFQIARTNGLNFGNVLNVGQGLSGMNSGLWFVGDVPLQEDDRVIADLFWADEDNLLFFMGRAPYTVGGGVAGMDLYRYELSTGEITNLTLTGQNTGDPPTDAFGFGAIDPRGSFTSPNGLFRYFVRGGIGPPGTFLSNVVGLTLDDLTASGLFSVTGANFGPPSGLPVTVLPPEEQGYDMQFTVGSPPAQASMVYFTAHRSGGNGADDLFAFDMDDPFVNLALTQNATPGVHVTNIAPNPYASMVAFARTATAERFAPKQHPYVIDLGESLFERDLVPGVMQDGMISGRVMDGSFHFVAPTATTPSALVFSFGEKTKGDGIAAGAPPAYYPLANVSNTLNEPVPVLIPLADTNLLGPSFRFYVLNARTSPSDD